jgi:hypothetical protein
MDPVLHAQREEKRLREEEEAKVEADREKAEAELVKQEEDKKEDARILDEAD